MRLSFTPLPRLGLAVLSLSNPLLSAFFAIFCGYSTVLAQATEGKTLAGVWEVKISAGGVPPPPLLSLAIFGGDGSFTTTGNSKISIGGLADQRGPGYGRWLKTGDREFRLIFYAVLLKEGEVNGYMRVRSNMTLSDSGNDFTSQESHVDFLDKNWNVVDRDDDQVTGRRLETP